MEKSKIISQDLIESGGGDLIFETVTPAKFIFDLQRFEDGAATATLSAGNKIMGIGGGTINRLSTSTANKISSFVQAGTAYSIPTYSASDATAKNITGFGATSYTLKEVTSADDIAAAGFDTASLNQTYSASADGTRHFYVVNMTPSAAITLSQGSQNNGHLAGTGDEATALTAGPGGYWLGFQIASTAAATSGTNTADKINVRYSTKAATFAEFLTASTGTQIETYTLTNEGYSANQSATIKVGQATNVTYTANEADMTNFYYDLFQTQGGQTWVRYQWTKDGTALQTDYYAINFYDAFVSGAKSAETAAGFANTSHVANIYDTSTNLAFTSKDVQLNIDNSIIGRSQKINGWDVSFGGTTANGINTLTASKDGTRFVTYSLSGNSDATIAFAFNQTNSTFAFSAANATTYTTGNNSGTIKFSVAESDDDFSLADGVNGITLGDAGKFTVTNGKLNTAYHGLEDGASATFTFSAADALYLDIDGFGTANSAYSVMAFSGTASAQLSAIAGQSDISLISGQFTATGTSMYNLGYVMSNSTKLTIGGYTFADKAGDKQNTFISFADNTSATALVDGNFSATFKNHTFFFSDTQIGTLTPIKFGSDGKSLTMGAGVNVTATGLTSVTFSNTATQDVSGLVNGQSFKLTGAYDAANADKNTVSWITGQTYTYATPHASYALNSSIAGGIQAGDNIELGALAKELKATGGTSTYVYGGVFFDVAGTGAASGTFIYNAASDITVGGTLNISGVSDTSIVGLAGEAFTATKNANISFFLRDGGTGTSINGITFNEISDSYVSKLAYKVNDSSMTLQGALQITGGSNTAMTYVLGNPAPADVKGSFLQFGEDASSLSFSGTGLIGLNGNVFSLAGSATKAAASLVISGTSASNATYSLGANSSGTYQFGLVNVDASKGLKGAVEITGLNGNINSADVIKAGFTVDGGTLKIDDKNDAAFGIELNTSTGMLGATINGIDSGATLYSLASATSVVTNNIGNDAVFTFSTTFVGTSTAEDAKALQIFTISGDADGVTFNVNSKTGLVTSLSGLSNSAVIKVTDYTTRGTKNTWTHTVTGTGTANTWKAWNNGIWNEDKVYTGYFVVNTSSTTTPAFVVGGIVTSTGVHEAGIDNADTLVGSGTAAFNVVNNVFTQASASSIFFATTSKGYEAKQGESTLFSNLTSGNSGTGLLFTSASDGYVQFATMGKTGSATALTALNVLNNNTLSVTLGDKVARLYEGFNVSGTGVYVSATKDNATIGAVGVTKGAYVNLTDADGAFAFGSDTGIFNIYSGTDLRHALTVNGTNTAGTVKGSNTSIFAMTLGNGAIVSDTFTTGAESSLKVNGTVYNFVSQNADDQLVVTGGTKDTATFVTGTFSLDSFDNAKNLGLGFNKEASLVFDGYSYTGVANASLMTLSGQSNSHIAAIAGNTGEIQAQLAEDKVFSFYLGDEASVFTATSQGATYNLLGTAAKNVFIGGSATGILKSAGEHVVSVLSDAFKMPANAQVTLVHGTTGAYSAQSATTIYSGGTGSNTFTTFALSNEYFASGTATTAIGGDDKKIYKYTSVGDKEVKLTLGFTGEGKEYINYVSGVATRSDTTFAGKDFVFNLVTGTGVAGVATTYTAIGDAFYFSLASNTTAAGSFYGGSGTRVLGADATLAVSNTGLTSNYLVFNDDSYTTLLGGTKLQIGVKAGLGTETFVSGSATSFVAAATSGIFHFSDTSIGNNAYTAVSDLTLFASFANSDTDKGVLYAIKVGEDDAVGLIGNRTSTGTETKVFWNDSYTLNADASLGLSVDASLHATETVTLGTATYSAAADKVFHIAQGWTGSTTALTGNESTYSYTAVNPATLNLYIDGSDYKLQFAEGLGTRLDSTVDSFTFKVGSTVQSYTKLAGSSLVFKFDSGSTVAAGSFYGGSGTRVLGADATLAVSNTALTSNYLVFNDDSYTTLLGGTKLQIGVKAGLGTETFVSGSASFVAAASNNGIFHFSDTSIGNNAYTAVSDLTLFASFANSDTDKGVLYAIKVGDENAEGLIGNRTSTGTETKVFWNDSYTLNANAALGLSVDASLNATETVTLGTATYSAAASKVFNIAQGWTGSTTTLTGNESTYSYTAVNPATLNAYINGSDYKLQFVEGLGTRLDSTVDSFTFKVGSTVQSYTKLAGSSLVFKFDSGSTVAAGSFYGGSGSRVFEAAVAVSDTAMGKDFLTWQNNSYTQLTGATLNIAIKEGQGTETFVSGSATFTQDSGYFYAVASGSTLARYTMVDNSSVTMSAVFTSISDAKVYAASGIGNRTLEGTQTGIFTLSELNDTFKMQAGSIAQITLSNDNLAKGIYGVENFSSGTGVMYLNPTAGEGSSTSFAISGKYLGSTDTTIYTYTASTTGTLNLALGADGTSLKLADGLVATRDSGTAGAQFVFDPDGNDGPIKPQTYSMLDKLTYSISEDNYSTYGAAGQLFSGQATRSYSYATDGTNTIAQDITFRGDKYQVTEGTITLNVVNGVASETFTAGTATYTANTLGDYTTFKFDMNSSSSTSGFTTYSATSVVELQVGIDANGSATGLIFASGTGNANVSDKLIAISDLGNNPYSFTGLSQLTMTGDPTAATEKAWSGTGTFSPTSGTAIVAFGTDGTFGGTIYSYTSFANATFSIGMDSGTVKTQAITAGTATRNSDGENFTLNRTEYKSTITNGGDTASMTFVLSAENAKTYGAMGGILAGVGYRNATDSETYEGIPTYTHANSYTLTTDAVIKVDVKDSTGTETLYYGAGTRQFANSETFYYRDTQYTASGSATMVLSAAKGEVSELLSAGAATFLGKSSDTQFEYGGNMYNVSGTALLKLVVGQSEPEFRSGTGVMDIAAKSDNTFVYIDQNTYTLTSAEGRLVAHASQDENGSTTAKVNFLSSSAKAEDNLKEGSTFYFDPVNDGATGTKLYTASEGGVKLSLNGVANFDDAQPSASMDGVATRQETATGISFTFENASYTSTAELTYKLESASETAYAGKGSRAVDDNATFAYQSKYLGGTDTFKAAGGVKLDLNFNNGAGTETLVAGTGTKDLSAGTTFTLNDILYQVADSGTIKLTAVASGTSSAGSGLLGMAYETNTSKVNEVIDANANRTASDTFNYLSIVTNSTTSYSPLGTGVLFNDTIVESVRFSSTWVSGSATMSLGATTSFTYSVDNASHTYTAGSDGAGFTRVSQENEYLTSGFGEREAEAADVGNFTYTYLQDAFTAAAGGTITLSNTGVIATDKETYSVGSATFAAAAGSGQFHFVYDGNTNTYTATADVNLTAAVTKGALGDILTATGAGTRGFSASDSNTKLPVLGDDYTLTDGTYSLDFTTAGGYNASETLTAGAGQFVASSGTDFHVSNKYFNVGDKSETVYTYTALNETTLSLTIGASETITFESGLGTRNVGNLETLDYGDYTYTSATGVAYAISNTGVAAGYLYSAVASRTSNETTTMIYREDTYKVDASGTTMVLTVKEGKGSEALIGGSATYTANAGEVFHFGPSTTEYTAYTAIADGGAKLMIAFGSDTTSGGLKTIEAYGTRLAGTADTAMSDTFQGDTYNVVEGSSTFAFTATSTTDTDETLLKTTGILRNEVASNDVFHTNNTGSYAAYTANGAFTIDLSLGNSSVQAFTGTVDAYNTASDTTFTFNSQTYSAIGNQTYSLTGSGTGMAASALTYGLDAAAGTRGITEGQYISTVNAGNWNNTYTLNDGTYSIAVTDGTGTETLMAGAGTANYAVGGSLHYGDSLTAYIAKEEGATLGVTISNSGTSVSEALTKGAIWDQSNTYLMMGDAKVTLDGISASATLSAVNVASNTMVTVTTSDFDADTYTGGLVNISNKADVSVTFENGGSLAANGKLFVAAAAGTLTANNALDSYSATSTFRAIGNFDSSSVALMGDKVELTGDTEVAVAFGTRGITEIESLSGGVTVTDAAGATQALTDQTGTFIFRSTYTGEHAPTGNTQNFTVSGDSSVTFQLDSSTGLVTGIAGLDSGAEVTIIDTGDSETKTISGLGQVMSRNSDGTWTTNTVVAEAYLVSVTSGNEFGIYAIDASGTPTKIDNNRLAGVTSDSSTITLNFSSGTDGSDVAIAKGVYVVNEGTKVINTGLIDGISKTTDNAAVKITDSDNAIFAGTIDTTSGYAYSSLQAYTIANGKFSVDATGGVDVGADNTSEPVTVTAANDSASVDFVASKTASQFQTTESATPVTLTIGDADADGSGLFSAVRSSSVLGGLNPNGVDTGTAVVESSKDSDTTTTFSIGDAEVKVTNDNDSDGMTLEIKDNVLYGLSNISTDATINASGATSLVIDGTDTVTVGTDSIKYNAIAEQWVSGNADAVDASAYLVSVNGSGEVELYFAKSANSTLKQTTNRADYVKVLGSGMAPTNDGEALPAYSSGIAIQSTVATDTKVSVVSASSLDGGGINVTNANGEADKDLILVTANGNYTVNGQEIIPSTETTVTAVGNDVAQVTLNTASTIKHSLMTFNASSDTAVAYFGDGYIELQSKAHVANTDQNTNFFVTGTVTFDSIAVVTGSYRTAINNVIAVSSLAGEGSGLTANYDKSLTVAGGDLAYTVNVSDSTPTISGIDANATVNGTMATEAYIVTASNGTFKLSESDEFITSNDTEVGFRTSDSKVVAIESLNGAVMGNFADAVDVDGAAVRIINDTSALVTANGTKVAEISGLGSDSTDVVVAQAGGATVVATALNGSFYFGDPSDSTVNAHHYNVTDEDSSVRFLTSSLSGYVPNVIGVESLNTGSVAISNDESGFLINSDRITLSGVETDVTVAVSGNTLTAVNGLQGLVNGLQAGVSVNAVDSDVTINGAAMQIVETSVAGGTNLTVNAIENGFDTVRGLNTGASVTTAKNAYVVTEDEGQFTFIGTNSSLSPDTYTISGDNSVTFETDDYSRVKNIDDFAGTLRTTAKRNTVNGSVVEVAPADSDSAVTDVTIASAGTGVSSVLGLGSNDSVTVPTGAHVQMPANTANDSVTSLTVNGKSYALEGDSDGVDIIHGASVDTITTLAANASLTVGAAGTYVVNSETVTASIGDVIIGDAEGSAHIYDPTDIVITDNDSTEDIVKKLTGYDSEAGSERYVKSLNSETAKQLLADAATDPTALDGNLEMTLGGGEDTDTAQSLDFSNNSGIKKVNMTGDQSADIKFNDAGGNILVVEDGSTGNKNIELGNGGDVAVIGQTDSNVNVKAGRGADQISTKARRASIDVSAGGPTRVLANGGIVELAGYDASTGAGIQVNNSSVKKAIRNNTIGLQNGVVNINGNAQVTTNPNAEATGASTVNFYDLKGHMTKVGYTHDEGGTVDFSNETSSVVMKGNFTEGGAQTKGGGSVMRSGVGNDAAFGGAGDTFNLGAGENEIEIDSNRQLSDKGAVIEQTATSGRTEVTGFNFDYGDMGDRINISLSAGVTFKNGQLTFTLGQATLILNTSSSGTNADLATSADGEDASKIGNESSSLSQKILIGDADNAARLEVAQEGAVIRVERLDGQLTQAYRGENSGVNLGGFEEAALINLNTGVGNFAGEETYFYGINKLQGGSGEHTLVGNGSTNNTIAAGSGNNSVWGGGASNDSLYGDRSDSTKSGVSSFFYVTGDGRDTVDNFTFLTSENRDIADRVNFLTTQIVSADVFGTDVLIGLANENDKLTIKDAVGQDIVVEYSDGTDTHLLAAQINNSTINFDGRAQFFRAMDKNATVVADSNLDSANIWLNNDGNVSENFFSGDIKVLNASSVQGRSTLVGNANDNIIYASSENSSMWGSAAGGNDTMVGGSGSDWFWFGKNNGNDVVNNVDSSDILNFYDVSIDDVASIDMTNTSIAIYLKDSVGGGSLLVNTNNSGVGFRTSDGAVYAADQQTRNWYVK